MKDVTYTVHIERVGDDPYLESLTVDGQYGETEYEDDNVKLVLKSSAKLNSVEPVLQIHGDDYSPKGAPGLYRFRKKSCCLHSEKQIWCRT